MVRLIPLVLFAGLLFGQQQFPSSGSGGGSPAGSNSEYQYRGGSTSFGAVSNSGPVPINGWTLQNCGTTQGRGAFNNFSPLDVSLTVYNNTQLCLATQTLGAPPYTVIATIRFTPSQTNSQREGLFLFDGTKAYGIDHLSQSSGEDIDIAQYAVLTANPGTTTNATSYVSSLTSTFKVVDDGTHRTWYYYANGAFVQLLQETTATFLTPTAVGFGGESTSSAGNSINAELLYWCSSTSTTCNGN